MILCGKLSRSEKAWSSEELRKKNKAGSVVGLDTESSISQALELAFNPRNSGTALGPQLQ